ncbi:MAG: hypothetical protein PHW98_05920 [Candidatus Omnitrophica bacterium]|nr:hypothetical protein [Candidatus Omnitrophota bacterium]MDD5771772.1 hypothetical protein [Candidatus Omnitrophota bacterium]
MRKALTLLCVSLGLSILFISGCVYITHLDDVMFLKGMESNQKQMQAQMEKEEKLYEKLKTDIREGRLKALVRKDKVVRLYGEPTLCKPAEFSGGIKETCVYRKQTGGLITEIISLDFDGQDRLCSWQAGD